MLTLLSSIAPKRHVKLHSIRPSSINELKLSKFIKQKTFIRTVFDQRSGRLPSADDEEVYVFDEEDITRNDPPKKIVYKRIEKDTRSAKERISLRPVDPKHDILKNNPRLEFHEFDQLYYKYPSNMDHFLVSYDSVLKRTWEDDLFELKMERKDVDATYYELQGGDWGGWRKPTGIPPRCKIYYAKIVEYFLQERYKDCISVYENMINDFMLPIHEIPVGTFRTMLNAFIGAKEWDKALESFYHIKNSFDVIYDDLHNLMIIYYETGNYSLIHDIFETFTVLGYAPTAESYSIRVKTFIAESKVEEAEKLVEKIDSEGIVDPSLSYFELLKGYEGLEEYQSKYKSLLNKIMANEVLAQPFVYHYFIKKYNDQENYQKAKKIFLHSVKHKRYLDKDGYGEVLRTFCRMNDPTNTLRVLNVLEKRKIHLSLVGMIEILKRRNDWVDVQELNEVYDKIMSFESVPLTPITYRAIQLELMDDLTYTGIQSAFSMIRKNRIGMDAELLDKAVRVMLKQNDYKAAKQFYIQEKYGGDCVEPFPETTELMRSEAEKNNDETSWIDESPDLSQLEFVPPPTEKREYDIMKYIENEVEEDS